ncbi:MAG TPA: hypothetical protein VH105_05515 [Burkholderiales bacterium]|nr:hypothetical protein [Burkholderiales bacterium]
MITGTSELAVGLAALRQQPLERVLETLHGQLDEYAAASLEPQQRAALIELIRAALPAEAARAAKTFYADRPLPLAERERGMLDRVLAVYAALQEQYRLCYAGFEEAPASPQRLQDMAGALQRAIHTIVSRMIEGYRARQVLSPALWDALHHLVGQAHALGVGKNGVADELNPNQVSSIDTTYGRAILLAAAQAGAMVPRMLDATLAMTALLEPFIDCSWQPVGEPEQPHSVTHTGRLRVLRTAGVSHLLNNARLGSALQAVSAKLAAGEPVASLDVLMIDSRELSGLLARLYRVWCGAGEIRAGGRERTEERVAIESGGEAIYCLLSGNAFAMPRQFNVYSGSELPSLAPVTARGLPPIPADGPWKLLDRSEQGLRAVRTLEGERLTRGMLMGIRSDPALHLVAFSVGEIRWVQEERGVGIVAGVKLQPGKAEPVPARLIGGADGSQYQAVAPIFLLDQAAAPKMVVPLGWWKPDRVIDALRDGAMVRLRMGELMLRGADFEIGRFVKEKSGSGRAP